MVRFTHLFWLRRKVKKDLLSRAQSMGMQNYIFRVIVPEEQKTETVRGKKQEVDEKVFQDMF